MSTHFVQQQEDQQPGSAPASLAPAVKKILEAYTPVREVMVVEEMATDAGEQHRLVIFFTTRDYVDTDSVPVYLQEAMPGLDVACRFIYLQKFPVKTDGSIDATKVAHDLQNYLDNETAYQPPSNETEHSIASIWSQVLNRNRVSIDDNFFKSTGNSLKAIQIVSRMHKTGYKVTIKDIFNHPTIRQLAAMLNASTPGDVPAAT